MSKILNPDLLHTLDTCEEALQVAISGTYDMDLLDLYQQLLKCKQVKSIYTLVKDQPPQRVSLVARALVLSLELISACEAADRIHRSRVQRKTECLEGHLPYALTYVFTAHPTEARSPELISIFKEIQKLIVSERNRETQKLLENLLPLLSLALRLPVARESSPQVADEAMHIFSYVLHPKILKKQMLFKEQGLTVHFRTWVGGDKDGHPFVDEKTLYVSLSLSRREIVATVKAEVDLFLEHFFQAGNVDSFLKELLQKFSRQLETLSKLCPKDGVKIKRLHEISSELNQHLESEYGGAPLHLRLATHLLWLYPALVLPLEIREDAHEVMSSLTDKSSPLNRMMGVISEVSEGFEARWYVRGFVISQVMESEHLNAGLALVNQNLQRSPIPVVPLFENAHAIENSVQILKAHFETSKIALRHQELWSNRFEVMLGYSDSSKESGVLFSRLKIADAMRKIDQLLSSYRLTPVFFQGSGGSIERGGGPIDNQVQGWPLSALNIYKLTVQGETVARDFGHSELFDLNVKKLLAAYQRKLEKKPKPRGPLDSKVISSFTTSVQSEYQRLRLDPEFLRLLGEVTPYPFLSELKLGSRPAGRSATSTVDPSKLKIRAIPWVLCFTQSQLLIPTWWGIGTAYKEAKANWNKAWFHELKETFRKEPELIAFVHTLGFTLEKVDLKLTELNLSVSELSIHEQRQWMQRLSQELKWTHEFYEWVGKGRKFSDRKPLLSQSLLLRQDQTRALTAVQTLAIQNEDMQTFRETVTGIASGMMTTG